MYENKTVASNDDAAYQFSQGHSALQAQCAHLTTVASAKQIIHNAAIKTPTLCDEAYMMMIDDSNMRASALPVPAPYVSPFTTVSSSAAVCPVDALNCIGLHSVLCPFAVRPLARFTRPSSLSLLQAHQRRP